MAFSSRSRRPLRNQKVRKVRIDPEVLESLDYKSATQLRRFITDKGKILPRRQTGLNAKQQRRIATHIKRARFMALLHYTADQQR